MIPAFSRRSVFYLWLFLWTILPSTASLGADNPELQSSGSCDQAPAFYSAHSYRVGEVVILSPFDYLHGVRSEMIAALGTTHVRKNDEFKVDAVVEDRRKIKERLSQIASTYDLPFVINVVIAEIKNCHPEAKPPTVDVEYSAFASWFPLHFAPSYETLSKQSAEPDRSAGVSHKRLKFLPQAGYNRTTRLFGGLDLSAFTPLGILDVQGYGSTSSHFVSASQAGHYTSDNSWVQNLEWRTGYLYSDVPSDKGRLVEARAFSQFAVTSAPAKTGGALIRFGAAIGGGHDQSTLVSSTAPPATPLNNPAGELKSYGGVSFAAGHQSFNASYGVKLGQSQTGARIDFVKHVVDVADDFRFFPGDHKTLSLETRFAAGKIQNLGSVPLTERFFGGNSDQDFLPGDSWKIRSGPFIRSIPQNRLNRLAPDAPIGGENFFSTNLTLAFTVWHRVLVPDEIRLNPEFRPLLNGELKSARTTLNQYWKSKDPKVADALKFAPTLETVVGDIRKQFNSVKDSFPEDLSDRSDDCDFQITLAETLAANSIKETNVSRRFNAISSLVAKDDDGSIDNLSACLSDLKAALGSPFVADTVPRLAKLQQEVRDTLGKIDNEAAKAKTDRDMKFITQTVNTLIDQVNFASISPALVFDTARIGPQAASAGGGIRYGVGGGIRFSLLDTVRFTAGYAFNPNPKSWEGRGAAFFNMEIVSLFR